MKFILALALTCCLFSCKEKEPGVSGPLYGLVGTYEATSIKPAPIFQALLPDYDNFNETTTAIISQIGTDTYRLEIKTIGTAKKGSTNPINYGFTADMTGTKTNTLNEFKFKGKYSNLIPSNLLLDKSNKDIESEIVVSGMTLNVLASIEQDEGPVLIVNTTLTKTK